MCAASFVPLTIVITVENFTKHGYFLDITTLSYCFSKADKIFIYWWLIAFINFCVIPLVKWIVDSKVSKIIWIPIYLTQLMSLVIIPIYVVE
jgi:hypothetical protein